MCLCTRKKLIKSLEIIPFWTKMSKHSDGFFVIARWGTIPQFGSYLWKCWSYLHENFIMCILGQGIPVRFSKLSRFGYRLRIQSRFALVEICRVWVLSCLSAWRSMLHVYCVLTGWHQNVSLVIISRRHQMSGRLQWHCGRCSLVEHTRGLECLETRSVSSYSISSQHCQLTSSCLTYSRLL